MSSHHFDAIVVGSGISGGWAAKELCELGLRTLMLERGPMVEHRKDYPGEGKAPWDLGKPQRVFVEAADQITGPVLDAGCGTGDNALFFTERGQQVTGIDFLEMPIAAAKHTICTYVCPAQQY